ncbi:hypothetical protein [Vibrio fluminensis]|uniref:hypothetical protein n=1 Tax=Vibrio fluminensis TaxID=2783614 RepID=UPI0018870EFA|nr:hypothetical protein [Vibrio fluminensis]
MFKSKDELKDQVKIGVAADDSNHILGIEHYLPFSQLTDELMQQLGLDLLFVIGASPLQTALVKYWGSEQGCIVACLETLNRDVEIAERVIINIKSKLEGVELPHNINVGDIRHLAQDDNQLLVFNQIKHLKDFLDDPDCPYVESLLYLMHGEFSVERFEIEQEAFSQCLSQETLTFYSHLTNGLGECTALVSVKR